jgi:hypothetical protein
MSAYLIRTVQTDDDEGIRRLLGAPQPSAMLTLGFERSPSYLQAATVSHVQPEIIVAEHKDSSDIVAVVNFGQRPVFVNGECSSVRFGADLRVAVAHQGGRLLVYFNRRLKKVLGDRGWYQTVILNENERSKSVFVQGGRAGMPFYAPQSGVETFTLTGIKQQTNSADCVVRMAKEADIPDMNSFVQGMARFYQFLPVYDFNGLLKDDPYFRGLSIDDFVLVERRGELVALGALWNQKAFKQTRVVAYKPWIQFLRPIYNLWTHLRGGLHLPSQGELLDYRLVHSPLTAPDDSEAFSILLQALWERCQQAGGRALSLSLATTDPRKGALEKFRYFFMAGTHYLGSFSQDSFPALNESLVPYFECGRL